jgi:LPXTG-motif cell wall-anchored protein
MNKFFPFFTGTDATGKTTVNVQGIIGFLLAVGIAVFLLRKAPVADRLVKGA